MSTRVVKLGNAILGEWRAAAKRPAMPTWERQAKQRRNSLSRLVKFRRENGGRLGPEEGWIAVLGNTVAALRQPVDVQSVAALAARLGLPPFDFEKAEGLLADTEQARRVWSTYRLRTPAQVASLLQVTRVERDECRLRDIEAVDEPASDRKRRLARERQTRRRREAGNNPSTQAQKAAAAGISLATWKRRHKSVEPKSVTLPELSKGAHARDTCARVNSVTPIGSSNETGGADA